MVVREAEAAVFDRLVATLDRVEKAAGVGNEDVEQLRVLVEKISRQPAVFMPSRTGVRVAKDGQGPGHAPNIRVETLMRWVPGAPPETADYLRRCAQLEAQR